MSYKVSTSQTIEKIVDSEKEWIDISLNDFQLSTYE